MASEFLHNLGRIDHSFNKASNDIEIPESAQDIFAWDTNEYLQGIQSFTYIPTIIAFIYAQCVLCVILCHCCFGKCRPMFEYGKVSNDKEVAPKNYQKLSLLHDGENFIIEKYAITRIPAFNLIDTDYNKIKNAQILAMGASEFKELSPLPAVPVEIDKITRFLWEGKAFMNQEFTVKNLQQQRQKQPYEIVHLATHAEFKPGKPDKSYIQFWNDEQIGLDELEKLKLNQPPVELLVLSACRTALGDKEAELGFAGLTVKSGVRSALASLWNVSDIGTLALMTEFYEHLQKTSLKAEALRQAQVAMLKGKVDINMGELKGTRGELQLPPELAEFGDETFSHPYYWSAFTLIGNPW